MTRATDIVSSIDKRRKQKEQERDAKLPQIKIGPDLFRVVDAAVEAIAHDPALFQRDGELVRVVHVAENDATRERMTAGTPQIRAVGMATLRERLTRMAKFIRYRAEEWIDVVPPDNVTGAVAERGEWPGVRPLIGIIETPSMRPDGTVIDAPGYDAATGYVYEPGRPYPTIPLEPTVEDARRALAALAEPWRDFPFRSEADRFVPVAALVTLVCRPAIRGACPAFIFDASTRGSGKTLLSRAVTTLAQGREAALMSWSTHDEEIEKILGAYALRGASVIVWDNLAGTFGGGPLDKVLTCTDRVELRVLGKSEVPALSWRAVTMATGNNVTIGGDTTRRVLVARLEPDVEKPEERTGFAIGDLAAWCSTNHARLVAAALTVARAYVVAGRTDQGLAGWGSFEAWRDLVGSAIVWAGGPDVMATRPTIAGEDDTDTASLRTIVELLPMLTAEGATLRTIVGSLYPSVQRGEQRQPDRFDALREALETLAPPRRPGEPPNVQTLGTALGRFRRRVVGQKYLDHVSKKNEGSAKWGVREVRR